VNVSPTAGVLPPIKDAPDTTTIVVAVVEVIEALKVVCCARDEYFLVVIYIPI
jgi:hypothetical protein